MLSSLGETKAAVAELVALLMDCEGPYLSNIKQTTIRRPETLPATRYSPSRWHQTFALCEAFSKDDDVSVL